QASRRMSRATPSCGRTSARRSPTVSIRSPGDSDSVAISGGDPKGPPYVLEDTMQRIIALASIAALLSSGCALPRATPATFSTAHAQAGGIRPTRAPRDAEERGEE